MDYEFLSQILERGGTEAVQAALEDFAGRASEEKLKAAVDLACQVIADDTARIKARGDRHADRSGCEPPWPWARRWESRLQASQKWPPNELPRSVGHDPPRWREEAGVRRGSVRGRGGSGFGRLVFFAISSAR